MRALAAAYGESIHLRLSAKYGAEGFCALLAAQDYIGSVRPVSDWQIEESAPIGPRVPALSLDDAPAGATVYHLGYESWPTPDLPRDVWRRVSETHQPRGERPTLPELDLATPWLSVPLDTTGTARKHIGIAVGFTDEHFELKYGISKLIDQQDIDWWLVNVGSSPRWSQEAGEGLCNWVEAATEIRRAKVFLGCCSALHVLAVGLGVPVICMEPNPNRLNDVFWPVGQDGPQVRLVRGNDGQATWDARHCTDAIREALR